MRDAVVEEVVVDELGAVVRVDAEDRERELGDDVLDGLEDPDGRLVLDRLRLMVQPVKMSVTVRVKQNSPLELPPSWPTRSISTNPGIFSLHSAQVRIGICDLSNVPGLVWERPRGNSLARSGARWRSMRAAHIETNRAASASVMTISPSRRKRGTTVASIGARRLPAGVRVSIQQMVRQATTWEPNFGVRVARGRAILSVPARRMAARQ